MNSCIPGSGISAPRNPGALSVIMSVVQPAPPMIFPRSMCVKTRMSPWVPNAWDIAVNESMTRRTMPASSMFRTISSQIAGNPSALSVGISRNRNRFFFSSGGRSRPRRVMLRKYALRPSSMETYIPGSPPSRAPWYRNCEPKIVLPVPGRPARVMRLPAGKPPSIMSSRHGTPVDTRGPGRHGREEIHQPMSVEILDGVERHEHPHRLSFGLVRAVCPEPLVEVLGRIQGELDRHRVTDPVRREDAHVRVVHVLRHELGREQAGPRGIVVAVRERHHRVVRRKE